MQQDREYLRVKLFTEATFGDGKAFEKGKIANISLGGVYLMAKKPKPEGVELNIKFTLPPDYVMDVKGKVVRVGRQTDSEFPAGMGIKLTNISSEDKAEIDHYVRRMCRVLRALFFELNKAIVNETKVEELLAISYIERRYPIDILREKITAELAYLRLRPGKSLRK